MNQFFSVTLSQDVSNFRSQIISCSLIHKDLLWQLQMQFVFYFNLVLIQMSQTSLFCFFLGQPLMPFLLCCAQVSFFITLSIPQLMFPFSSSPSSLPSCHNCFSGDTLAMLDLWGHFVFLWFLCLISRTIKIPYTAFSAMKIDLNRYCIFLCTIELNRWGSG